MSNRNCIVLFATGLVLFVLVVACGGGGNGGAKLYKKNENVKVGKALWKLLEVETGTEFSKKDGGRISAEGMFVLLNVSMKNEGNEQTMLTGEELELVDDSKNTYSFDSRNNNIYLSNLGKENLVNQGGVASGKTITGWIIFDVSKDSKGLKLKAKDIDIRTRESALVDLGL